MWNTWITVPDSGHNGDTLVITVDRSDTNMSEGLNLGWFTINSFHDSLESKRVNISARKLAEGDPYLSVTVPIDDFETKYDSLYCHVANDSGGYGEVAGTIFFRADLLPVMWVSDSVSIGVHNTNPYDSLAQDSAFDPTHAYHLALVNGEQVDFYADIYPHDPYEVLDSLELMFDTWLTHIRDEFDSLGVQSYEDILALGYIDWPRQQARSCEKKSKSDLPATSCCDWAPSTRR
ncbi:MAG: hypothetical protein GF398_14175 [Chitinivibrionales bacterium]|nr:hypothetical protein [Chitinivibrionales bacterium]